ncbi:MAG: PHP domain-containing protein, partial [Rugosibacter sp.]|nr:PHP domain-containing protein [Rugosibacter sp.]
MSPTPQFIHLRLHSEYAISDGITRLDEAIARAVEDQQPALALTDLANLFGMVKFYTTARSQGVKPIIGCDVWIDDDTAAGNDARRESTRLLLLVKNNAGYLRLCELISAAYLAPRRQGQPSRAEISVSQLSLGDNSGLIALSGGPLGDVGLWLAANKTAQAEERAKLWAQRFPGAYYIEVQRPSGKTVTEDAHSADNQLVTASADLAARLGLPLVATHPIQFLDEDDFKAHEARVCIAEGYVLGDKRRPKNFSPQQYFKTQAEMVE